MLKSLHAPLMFLVIAADMHAWQGQTLSYLGLVTDQASSLAQLGHVRQAMSLATRPPSPTRTSSA